MSDPIPTDFWGIVVPTWLGAVGSIGASIVAVVAIVVSRSTRSGVENLKSGLNVASEIRAEEKSDDADAASTARSAPNPELVNALSEKVADAIAPPRVRWRVVQSSKNRYALLNDSPAAAAVSSVKDISDGYRDALSVLTPIPASIDPGSQIIFTIHRSFASPAVTAIEVQWTEGRNGRVRKAVFYI